jgi:hypothetical protein
MRKIQMNDRIRELLEQAGVKFVVMPKDTEYEKFAELIVRECANLFDKDEMELTLTERTIHNIIKEHFGVKE